MNTFNHPKKPTEQAAISFNPRLWKSMASTALASALLATGAQAQQVLIPGLGRGGDGGGSSAGGGQVDNPTGVPTTAGGGGGNSGGGGGGAGTLSGQGGTSAGVGGDGGFGGVHDVASSFNTGGESGTNGGEGGNGLGGGGSGGGGGGAGGFGLVVVGTGDLGTQTVNRTGGVGGNGGFGDTGGEGGSGGVGLFIGASAPGTPLTGTINATISGGQGGFGGQGFFSGNGGNGGSGIVFGNNTVGLLNGLPNAAPVSLTINGAVSGGNGGDPGITLDFVPPGNSGQGGAGIVANGNVTLVLNGSVSGGLSGSNRGDALVFGGANNTVTFGSNYSQQGGVNVVAAVLTILQNTDFTIAPNTSGNIFGTDINAIFGAGTLRFTGTGTTTLTAENFYTGGTLIENGNVAISNAEALGTGPISFSGSGSLRATNSLLLDEQITAFSGTTITTLSAATGTVFSLAGQLTIALPFDLAPPAAEGFAENVITPRTLVFGSANDTGTVSLTGSSAVSGGAFEIRVAGGVLTGNSRRLSGLTSAAAAVDIESGATLEYLGIEVGQGIQFLIGEGNLIINAQAPAVLPADDGAANGPAPSQSGSQLTIGQGDFSGVISGDGSLRVGSLTPTEVFTASPADPSFAENDSGAVILRLTGANTYTGTTTIDAGRELILGNGGTTGSIGAGDVINDGSLAFERSDTVTFANNISGTGQLFQVSPGTLILTGNNTFSGGANILANSTLQVGSGTASGSLGTGAVVNDGTLVFGTTNSVTIANVISGTGLVDSDNFGGITSVTGENTYTGGTTIRGRLDIGNGGASGSLGAGAVNVMQGGTLGFRRSDATTFSNAITGTGDLVVESGRVTLTGNNTRIGNTAVEENATLSIDSASRVGQGALQIAGNLRLTGSTTFTNNFYALGGTLDTGANAITLAGAYIDDGDGLTKTGSGTLVFASTLNTSAAAGGLTLAGGTLSLQGNLGVGFGTITTTGSVIDYASGVTVAAPIAINSNTTQLQVLTGAATQSGVISELGGARPLEKIGAGALILTGANTYSGATTITAGTLQLGNGGTTGSIGAGGIVNNGTLALNRSDAVSLANVISGTGGLQHNGTGTTTLTGANTFSGGVGVNAGTLAVSNLASLGAGAVTVASGGTLQVTNAADATFGLGLSGAGTLRKLGAGVLTFASPASIGTLAVDAGQARINTTLTGAVAVGSGARVDGSGTIAGSVTNAGTFAPGVGLGGLTITGNYTQAAGGVLEIDYSAAGANIDLLTINGAATLAGTVRFLANDSSEASGGTFLTAAGGVTGAFSAVELVGASGPVSVIISPTTGAIGAPVAPVIATTRPTTLVSQLDSQKLLLRSVFTTLQPGGIDGLDFGLEPGAQPRRRVWAEGIGSTTEREARGDALSFNVDVYGTTFGGEIDTGVRGLSVGAFGAYVQTDIDLTASAGDGEQRGILGGAFLDWTHNATALRVGFLIGRIDQSTNRVVTFNGVDETLEGDTDSNARSIFANVGQRFGQIAGWSVSGHLSSVYSRLRQDAYVEQGANLLAVSAPALGVEQWTGDLRLQTSRVLGGADRVGPVLVRFAAGVSRTEAFGDNLVPVTLTNLGTEQLLDVSTREETVGLVDAGVRWQFTKLSELRLNYQGRYGSDTSHAVQAGVSFRF
jgi:autotransporter-associated beta strand protein